MIYLTTMQLRALAKLAKGSTLNSVGVQSIPRPGFPDQAMETISFVYGQDGLKTEGLMNEAGEVVA